MIGDDPPRAGSAPPACPEAGNIDDCLKKLDDLGRGGDANHYLEEAVACLRAGSN